MMDWVDRSPVCINVAEQTFIQHRTTFGNCLKGCKWAPDGSCICTNSEDHRIRIFNLPPSLCINQDENSGTNEITEMTPDLDYRESQIIYDYCWYPMMNSSDYTTCFFMVATRDSPIRLVDAYSCKISASYIALDSVYELVSARSVQFTPDGTKIIAGYEKFICLFDVRRPGQADNYIYDVPKGIISCIASGEGMFATGSYNKLIGLYDINTKENIAMLKGHKGGITHLSISPDSYRLYSGGRRDNEILCWDLRNYGSILHSINRTCSTNQRLYFDINFEHNVLATGDDDGHVRIYDLQLQPQNTDKVLLPRSVFKSHDNCVNGISLHPSLPLIASTSGRRCLLDFNECEDDIIFDYKKSYIRDNNMKLWRFSG